ncbi:hypothetical protein [Peribacillus butanolivorans]|nr:hypothetical protein [Peribacillus butanolivorans]
MDNLEMESELSEPKNLSALLAKLLANKIKKVKLICLKKYRHRCKETVLP